MDHLAAHFRPQALALEIGETAIDTYASERLQTAKLLGTTGPTITIPKAHNERQCSRAEITGRIPHDLRGSAASD